MPWRHRKPICRQYGRHKYCKVSCTSLRSYTSDSQLKHEYTCTGSIKNWILRIRRTNITIISVSDIPAEVVEAWPLDDVNQTCTAGIGTYASGDHQSVNFGLWGQFKRAVSRIVDRGICTSFDSHVMAAYRFMMRYYDHGDKICLFGFSRGAVTARFLARMIASIGVLSKGIEEMVPFAYKSYQDYENGTGSFKTAQDCLKWMESFKVTKSLMSKFIFWGYLILSIRLDTSIYLSPGKLICQQCSEPQSISVTP